jgi:hypothetical protein
VTISRRALAAALAAVVILALAFNSCGGKQRLSAPALRRDATKVCASARKQTDAIPLPGSSKSVEPFLIRGLGALEPELAELKLLDPPSAATPTYNRAVRAIGDELAVMRSAIAELNRGTDPIDVFRDLEAKLAPLETRADEAFRALQIDACTTR